MSEDLSQIKQLLRLEYREKRSSLTDGFRKETSKVVCEHIRSWKPFQRSSIILTYMPMGGEVDLLPLLETNPDKQWVIPRIQPHNKMVLHSYHPQKLIRHRFGMLEPDPELPRVSPSQVDLVLVPGLLFDRQGWRLGYGGGFYDNFLSGSPNMLTLGVTYQAFLLDDLPHGEHDIPVRALVTEEGILNFSIRMDD